MSVTRKAVGLLLAALFLIATAPASVHLAAEETSGGTGRLIIGTFPDKFWIIDEATRKIVESIPYESGIPRRTTMSKDGTRFYTVEAQMEKVEVIDIASRKTIDKFTLSEGNRHVRIRSVAADPKHRFVVMLTKAATKLVDRFEIGPPELVQYDLASRTITRVIPWPKGEERENANIQFSPDGSLMYLFSDQDVLIYETNTFTQTDTWELSKPIEDGVGRLSFGSTDSTNDEPGFYTGIFTIQDPVQNRRVMGIGRVNLAAKTVDFYTLGPATPVGFTMTPDRKLAYGLMSEIGRYEFWKFDLVRKQLAARQEFKGRPRMSMKTSSNGKVLYIYNAGATIDLYDAATLTFISAIQLPGDATTEMFVFPAGSAAAPATSSASAVIE
jgi:hypothetical protein